MIIPLNRYVFVFMDFIKEIGKKIRENKISWKTFYEKNHGKKIMEKIHGKNFIENKF